MEYINFIQLIKMCMAQQLNECALPFVEILLVVVARTPSAVVTDPLKWIYIRRSYTQRNNRVQLMKLN